jgi:hypothetical protein
VQTWSLALRKEYILRVFEERALKGIFGHTRERNWRLEKLHNKELHTFILIKWKTKRLEEHTIRSKRINKVVPVLN